MYLKRKGKTIKLGYNLNGFRQFGLEELLPKIAETGYKGVEFSLNPTHLHPFFHTDEYVSHIAKKAKESNLVISNIHTGAKDILFRDNFEPNLIAPDEEDRKLRLKLTKSAIEVARKMGVQVVTLTTGYKSNELSDSEADSKLKNSLQKCLDWAGEDVSLAIEPEPGMFIESTSQFLAISSYFDNRLFYNLDVGHAVCLGENPAEVISNNHKFIRHIHVEDIANKEHIHLLPGTGEIDFISIYESLSKVDYKYFTSVELYTMLDKPWFALQESYNFLSKVIDKTECKIKP